MKPPLRWIVLVVGLGALSAGIGRAIVARKSQQADLAQTAASASAQVLSLSARDVYTVASKALTHSIPVSGSLKAQRTALVKAKVAAELLSLSVREGDRVKQDQSIGQLDPQEFETRLQQARQQAASAKAQWQIARQTLDNNTALVKQGFISRNALNTSTSTADSAKATFEAAQSAVDLAVKALKDSGLRAPIGGQIAQRFAQPGERVPLDGRIVEIVDLSSLELQAPLSPQDVTQVRVGTPARLSVDGLDEVLEARIARINPSASADTRAVTVYLALPAHPALRQGLFAQGRIILDQREALAIPANAVIHDGGQDFILKVQGGQVIRQAIKLGPRAQSAPEAPGQTANLIEVLDGLKPGDQIISDTAGTVREGNRVIVSSQPAGH